MGRVPRTVVPDLPLHVTHRGNNRIAIFLDEDDFATCKDMLELTSTKFNCSVHAYAFMGNHIHLLLTPGTKSAIARMMQSFGIRYVLYFNDKYKRTGTLWEGRYKSALIQSSRYFFNCSRYIELNPVRALMVSSPELHRWTSFHRNALGKSDRLITPHHLYSSLGRQDDERTTSYRSLFEQSLDPDDCELIRSATRAGIAIGEVPFQQRWERTLNRRMTFRSHGGDRRGRVYRASLHTHNG